MARSDKPATIAFHAESAGADRRLAIVAVGAAPLCVVVCLSLLGFADFAFPGAVIAAVATYVWTRHLGGIPQARFTISHAVHEVKVLGKTVLHVPVEHVDDIRLDTKTIRRVQQNPSGSAEGGLINATVGPEIDTARIEIVCGQRTIPLTEEFESHIHATEWVPKLRRFLRESGWSPRDQRLADD